MHFPLIPREQKFYDMFDEIAAMLVEASDSLAGLFERSEEAEQRAAELREFEHRCDEAVANVLRSLGRTFITPVGREDLHALAISFDTVLDNMEGAAYRVTALRVGGPTTQAIRRAEITRRAVGRARANVARYLLHTRRVNKMVVTWAGEVLLIGAKGLQRGLERSELAEKYDRVDRDEARQWWEGEYAKTPATESRRFHILSGAIFPIYDKIMGSLGIHNVKIARATLMDGRALVGLNLSPSDVPNVKQRLGIGTPLGEASPEEILGLLAGGAVIELDNGWQLTTTRIAGDEVVDVILNGVPASRAELEGYGLSEEILSYKRRWFVVRADAAPVVSDLLAQRRPIRDRTANRESS